MKSYKTVKTKLLKNKKIKRAYKALDFEFALIEQIIKKRIEKGLTQKELASAIGTKQSAISRFESGAYNPTLSFVAKISEVLDIKLEVA